MNDYLPPTLPGRRARRGISLLEVLISMGILLFGLLGVGAMVPLGRMSIVAATKADRAAACGRAGLREVRLGRMLDVNNWMTSAGTKLLPTAPNSAAFTTTSFCIDPIMVGQSSGSSINKLPYGSSSSNILPMTRGTIAYPAAALAGAPQVIPAAVAARLFTASDDLSFYVPDDRQIRPERLFQTTTGISSLSTTTGLSSSGTTLAGQFEGKYSWMVTITPWLPEANVPSPTNPTTAMSLTDRRLYAVSVVVFYGRDTSQPSGGDTSSERVVTVATTGFNATFFTAGGFGGGTLQLAAPTGDASPGDLLAAKPDEWVLLCASLNSAPLKMPTMTGTNNYFPFYRWYRIVSLSDVSGTSRYVTLAGPDWPAGTTVAGAQMVLMRGVVGVYSDVLELEGDGLWNR